MKVDHAWQTDAAGQKNPDKLVGKQFVHVKTSTLYRVTDFMLNASTDQWAVQYERSDRNCAKRFPFTRDMAEFMDGRFIEVK